MTSKKILIVEDDRSVSKLIAKSLRKFGYSLAGTVSTGEQAVEAARESNPDLVLMDVSLAGRIDGVEAARQIRFGTNIPVVFLTALSDPATIDRAKLAEPLGYVLKPFRPEDLKAAIDTALYQFDATRNRMSEALSETTRKYDATIGSAVEGFYQCDPEGRYITANAALGRMLGHESLDQFKGYGNTASWELFADLDRREEFVRALRRDGVVDGLETRVSRKDGSKIWISMNARAVRDGCGKLLYFEGFAEAITERKRAEWELVQERHFMRALMDNITDAIYFKDLQSRFVRVNKTMAVKMGLGDPQQVVGRSDFDFFTEEHSRAAFEDEQRILETGQPIINKEERETWPDRPCTWVSTTKMPLRDPQGNVIGTFGISREITERKLIEEGLKESEEQYRALFETSRDAIMLLDRNGFFDCNQASVETFRCGSKMEFVSKRPDEWSPPTQPNGEDSAGAAQRRIESAFKDGSKFFEWTHRRADGAEFPAEVSLSRMEYRGRTVLQATVRDISDRRAAEQDNAMMEIQLRQALKLEAVGQLAAGIAHEINTPTQYVGDNIRFLQDAYGDLHRVLDSYGRLLSDCKGGRIDPRLCAEVDNAIGAVDLSYLIAEIPKAIAQSLEGVSRVTAIVRAMKEFSHPGGEEKQTIDLNHSIDSTLIVARNEWKYVAEVVRDFDPEMPHVPCLPSEFNQVILNLVVNAAQAIANVIDQEKGEKGTITVRTRREGAWAIVQIGDTGGGIPVAIREKLFTPFFTTKEVGKGTGQGLAISRAVIVRKHNGMIDFDSELGRGTTFTIRLPLESLS